jgi:hypothetical protein
MTWVVLTDPVPAGSTIIGSGLGGQSSLAAAAKGTQGTHGTHGTQGTRPDRVAGRTGARVSPVFEERSFEGWRGYWRYVPRGPFSAEYVVRLNQAGRFELPSTRVEAMYAPEVFGELPNAVFEVSR